MLIAAEIAAEPSVRRVVRHAYRSVAHLSTSPTAQGIEQISPFHELFGLHMLEEKPLQDLFAAKGADRYLYGRLMEAQSQGLIDVTITIPTISTPSGKKADLAPFFQATGEVVYDYGHGSICSSSSGTLVVQAVFDQHDIMSCLDLVKLYLPDQEDAWNEQRMLVLALAMEKYLLPHFKEEVSVCIY